MQYEPLHFLQKFAIKDPKIDRKLFNEIDSWPPVVYNNAKKLGGNYEKAYFFHLFNMYILNFCK